MFIFNFLFFLVAAKSDLPTCIIGGGPTGLTLAHKFIAQGIPTVVYEAESVPGGKVQTWRDSSSGHQVDLGALLFSNQSRNSLALFDRLGFHIKSTPHSEYTTFKVGTNTMQKFVPIDFSMLRKLYLSKRSQINLDPGYLNADPKLFVSLGEWLINNGLEALIPISQLLVTVSGYGSVYKTPALYGLKIIDEQGDLNDPLYSVIEGLDKVIAAYAKGINIKFNLRVTAIESQKDQVKLHFDSYTSNITQVCKRVITTFPPLYETLKQLINNTLLLSALEPVVITKYATFVTLNSHLTDLAYFATLDPSKNIPVEPLGQGHVSGLIKQGDAYASYSWYQKPSSTPASPSEVREMIDLLVKDIDILTDHTGSTTVPFYRNWAYFPHVDSVALKDGFYSKLHKAQGSGNIYVAGPIHSFETIHHSIEGANYFFKTYFNESK